MTIRSRLNASLAVAILLALAVSALMKLELRRVTRVVDDNLQANALAKRIIYLNSLTFEYLDAPSTRTESQWLSNYDTLNRQLREMRRDSGGMTRIPAHVVDNYANIKETFDQIALAARRSGSLDAGQPVDRDAFGSAFSSLLLKKNQELYDWVLSASEASNTRLLQTMQRDSALGVAMWMALALAAASALYLLKRRILRSITRLRQGVDTIRQGSLNHRIPLASRDEFGALSGAFNSMTAELQTLHGALESSLREKEALLKEVHHRVKNNLQIIISLLRLQTRKIDNAVARASLEDMQNRVRSMALIHEHLYRSENLAAVDLSDYLKSLCLHLFHALAPAPAVIELRLDLAPVRLAIDRAIPCGLLVNELVSNAIKHAFPGGRAGIVRVELQPLQGGEGLRLRVADNGVGLAAALDLSQLDTLGLQLVASLARQLGGRLDIQNASGAVFDLVFNETITGPPRTGGHDMSESSTQKTLA